MGLTSRGSSIERAQNPIFRVRFLARGTTVRSRGSPHRSQRQDWKRFLAPIGRYACATFEGPPSSRSRATLLAPSASGVILGRPVLGRRCKPLSQVLDVPRGRSCHAPLPRASSCLTRRLTMMPAEAGSAGSRSEPASRAVSLYRDKHLELVDYPVRVLFATARTVGTMDRSCGTPTSD